MKTTTVGFSIWVISCVSIGLGAHYLSHGDLAAVLKAALAIAITMIGLFSLRWGWQKLKP
ncbi:MAG: hypothetical protein QGI81_11045 [Pseudomonadales bacterium]|nr:hypothetical protein [Pseudomonadales bacterium]